MALDAIAVPTSVAAVANEAEVPVEVPSRGLVRGLIMSSLLRSGLISRM